jgi:hypothetical protein
MKLERWKRHSLPLLGMILPLWASFELPLSRAPNATLICCVVRGVMAIGIPLRGGSRGWPQALAHLTCFMQPKKRLMLPRAILWRFGVSQGQWQHFDSEPSTLSPEQGPSDESLRSNSKTLQNLSDLVSRRPRLRGS